MTYAAEGVEMKRKMVEKMDSLGKEHRQTMSELASSLKTLSDSVASAFSALNQVLVCESYQQTLAPPTIVPQSNYAHRYSLPVGPTFILSSSPYYYQIPQLPLTPSSSSGSSMSTPLPMPPAPSPASIATYCMTMPLFWHLCT